MNSSSPILTCDKLLERLHRGEIFVQGTWTEENIRAAAYDARIADDFLIVPEPGFPQGRRYSKGQHRTRPVILHPGEVAFLSTMEKVCLPWDVCANIGIKFGFARQGILVLTGLLVDPGFGLMQGPDGRWGPKPDERVHLLLANVGSNAVVINPGRDKAVSLQFFEIPEPSVKKYVSSGDDMELEFFGETSATEPGLAFFRHTTTAMTQIRAVGERLHAVERGTQQLVYFGVFLISTTIFAVAMASALNSLSSDQLTERLGTIFEAMPAHWPRALAFCSACVALVALLHVTLKFVASTITAWLIRNKRP